MALLKDVDFYQTRTNARKVLNNYRRLQRITGRDKIDLRSPIMTDMPKTPSRGNAAEDAMVQYMDAEGEQNAIVAALMALSLTNRTVLYYSFCDRSNWSNYELAQKVGYSDRQIRRIKQEALLEFAEAYKHGLLIAYT